MKVEEFLNKKPLFYKEIDYERMPRVWRKIKDNFRLPEIIHIVGTNGKGSTGRFLAFYLYKSGFKVGHYTSPHVLRFNERIWINGKEIDDLSLQKAHEKLLSVLGEKDANELSYFEYATLLAVLLMQECDYIVLEAGLGGEYDATAVFESVLTLLTSVDYDHKEFLGNTIEEITSSKVGAVKKNLIVGMQKYAEVYGKAFEISLEKNFNVYPYNRFLTYDELILSGLFIKKEKLPSFFLSNLTLALSAVKFLGLKVDLDKLKGVKIFGRCQKFKKNVTIDVGHNPSAAEALREHFLGKKVVLVYNSFADKDYFSVLKILKPVVKRVEIIDIRNERAAEKEDMEKTLKSLSLEFGYFDGIKEEEEYLVFGSFSVAEAFLKAMNEK